MTLNHLMAEWGGFDHQRQTMRIVTSLEDRYEDFPGLNLTYEVREGLVKHDTDYDVTDAMGYEPELAGSLECQIANLADEIAYNTADLEDGLRSGVLDYLEVRELSIWQSTLAALGEQDGHRLDDKLRARVIRRLIGIEISDAINATAGAIAERGIRSVDDVRGAVENVACFSDELHELNRELKAFLMKNFYRHPRVMRMSHKANQVLSAVFSAFLADPRMLPREIQARMSESMEGPQRVLCDYIAGFTDRYAIEEYKRLFDPEARV
jgi:dGTPase